MHPFFFGTVVWPKEPEPATSRAHAREKVTRIAIIDRPLSMIVGGRVGALFFIVCFLSVLEIQIDFCISPPACQMNE